MFLLCFCGGVLVVVFLWWCFCGVGISLVTLVLPRLCLSFCLACASSFGEV